jgi:hypothetical protein
MDVLLMGIRREAAIISQGIMPSYWFSLPSKEVGGILIQ